MHKSRFIIHLFSLENFCCIITFCFFLSYQKPSNFASYLYIYMYIYVIHTYHIFHTFWTQTAIFSHSKLRIFAEKYDRCNSAHPLIQKAALPKWNAFFRNAFLFGHWVLTCLHTQSFAGGFSPRMGF